MAMTDPAALPRPPLVAAPWPRLAGWLARRGAGPDTFDWAVAVGCFAAFTVPVLLDAGPARHLGAAAGFGVLAAAPLAVRRRWPVPVVLAVTLVYVVAALADVAFTPFVSNAGPNLAVAVYTTADRSRRRWSLAAAVVAGAATWASLPLALALHPRDDQDAVQLIAVALAWPVGNTVQAFRGYRRQLHLLERRRAVEELRLARAEERLRLSREVHDVVSHSLSAIAVQAGVARLVLAEQPSQAGAALSAIETASRSALDELRGLLRQLRDPSDTDETATTPTLADLPALIEKLRRAGLHLTYQTTGQPRPYNPAVEFSAYRIAQEALTNVTKHAPGAPAHVQLTHSAHTLTLTVTSAPTPNGGTLTPDRSAPTPAMPGDVSSTPQSSAPAGSGIGIPGMRQRAELLGGTLHAAPRQDGGFTVTARLPATQASSPPTSQQAHND